MNDDCLGCRLVSGGGLIAAGTFIYYQAINKTRFNKIAMYTISAGDKLILLLHSTNEC